jgi:hypothetical protein
VAHDTPTATPGINQHSPLDRLTPALQKKKKLNNKQGTEKDTQKRWWGTLSAAKKVERQLSA